MSRVKAWHAMCFREKNNGGSKRVHCSTLLVLLEKFVPPCGFGRYPSNQYFQHTEIQSHACTNLTKAIWIMFKLGKLIVDFCA